MAVAAFSSLRRYRVPWNAMYTGQQVTVHCVGAQWNTHARVQAIDTHRDICLALKLKFGHLLLYHAQADAVPLLQHK